jgi:hypothetical protein
MTPDEKGQAYEILHERLGEYISHNVRMQDVLKSIDRRLCQYFEDIDVYPMMHNGYEILCAVKFLRLLKTYEFDVRKV